MKIKSQWFKSATPRTPRQTASVIAVIAWRVTQNMLKQMRSARFDIVVGTPYFAFMREVLVFLTQVLDRMAYERMGLTGRTEFITALVARLAELLQDNEDTLLGTPAVGQPSHYDEFIELFNQLADHYADFGFGPDGPDFAFVRYLGHRIEAIMPQKDQRWVVDQIMAVEVPEAVETLQRGMQDVFSVEPRAARPASVAAVGN